MNRIMIVIIVLIYSALLSNCSVKAPEVNITGEKTALEKQVIGTYQDIEQDSWTIASVRSTTKGNKRTISQEKKKVLKAVQNRKFNKDDINEFKREGIVGENNRGYLEIRNTEKLQKDPKLNARVEKIVAEENDDRSIIMNRAIQINDQIEKADPESVVNVFAKIYQDESEDNTWIQTDNGDWIKKKSK